MEQKRSVLCTVALVPTVAILLVLSWLHGSLYDEVAIQPDPEITPSTSYVMAGYFVNWGIYDRKYNVVDLEKKAEKLSHVLYAFANVQDDGEVVLGDAWADRDKHFPEDQTIDGKADQWIDGDDTSLYGNLKQFHLLKKKHRHLKVSLSIGGWSWSGNFSKIASDPVRRAHFAFSAAQHMNDYGLDGIDIDWEMPQDDAEARSYVDLLTDLRSALGSDAIISVAVPCGPEDYRKLHLEEMNAHVDLFYLMAYDYAGPWDPRTGHQAALLGGKDELNDKNAAAYYAAAGVPNRKLVLGIPVYGRGFSNTDGVHAKFQGVPDGSWEAGSYDYKDLPRAGATEFVDRDVWASYSYDETTREFVTYDNPDVVRAKCDFVASTGMAGVMFWELSADSATPQRSLIDAAYTALDGQLDTKLNKIEYPNSRFKNIRE